MGKGYVAGLISVKDLVSYKPYMSQTAILVEEYGGRYLVRGGDIDIVEGSTPHDRFVVIEFESREIAENFYNDPRYVKFRKIRQAYSDGLIFQATGFESP